MKGIVEAHGGTVEKFIGDAVMAVFGVPQVHEDDALRACRAAVEMRDALPELGVQARIGVNTGEVVTGTEERLATGDAVNVAARLEQAAQPGEILIGEETLALVRDAVETEPVEPLELKGKAEPVPAYRLVAVREAPERRHETPFVGRSRELELAAGGLAARVEERRCELVTVVGDAGVGKSRLVASSSPRSRRGSSRGRCLPYGEGITYWPVVEVVKQLDALPVRPGRGRSDPLAARRDASEGTIGRGDRLGVPQAARGAGAERRSSSSSTTSTGARRRSSTWSSTSPSSRPSAPILLLCMARPELLERRPHWPVALRLEPLGGADVDELIPRDDRRTTCASGSRAPPAATRSSSPRWWRWRTEPDGEVAVPPTLQALLAARLDQLEPSERRVLERGAVEGEVFHRGAVQALAPDEAQVTAAPRLARPQGAHPARPPQLPDDDAFRFRHLLHPRRRLRRAARRRRAPSCTSASPTGWRSAEPSSSSWTRSSATTSSRRLVTSAGAGTARPDARRAGGRATRRRRPAERSRAGTTAQPHATSLERALELTRPLGSTSSSSSTSSWRCR